jgi:hypothetical protein
MNAMMSVRTWRPANSGTPTAAATETTATPRSAPANSTARTREGWILRLSSTLALMRSSLV